MLKAVKWNSPFYGVPAEAEGKTSWFLSFHVFTKYLKVTFFRGAELDPLPPVGSKDPNTRYLHIEEGKPLDEAQFTEWLRQAAARPGWVL